MELISENILKCPQAYQILPPFKICYGTAGFRAKACNLSAVVYRVGILAAIRSKLLQKYVAVILTASHNPIDDNGVKIADPSGEMMSQDWEKHCNDICSIQHSELADYINNFIKVENIDLSIPSKIITGRDTRPSGIELYQGLLCGINVFQNINQTDYGVSTTPCVHFLVREINLIGAIVEKSIYFSLLSKAVHQFFDTANLKFPITVYVDDANGVGGFALKELTEYDPNILTIKNFTSPLNKTLNSKCGADYVKMEQKPPIDSTIEKGPRYFSFDGDADRVVYYFKDSSGIVHFLDGDYLSALFADYLCDCLQKIPNASSEFKIGVIQTAYSNSASTKYLTNKGISVIFTKTGVKYLHEEAKKFDIGVYFEANGHGTILFSKKLINYLEMEMKQSGDLTCITKLYAIYKLMNQAVGDAISNFLCVELILNDWKWDCNNWLGMFKLYPNLNVKVPTKNKDIIKNSHDEQKVTEPLQLQLDIDAIVSSFKSGRAFVRPSGTEDIVRIYAEATSMDECLKMVESIKTTLLKYCS